MIPIDTYTTEDMEPDARYAAWLARDWPRAQPIYRTVPTEPFNVTMQSAVLGQTVFLRTTITAMTWERREQDIRDSDFQPIVVSVMVRGTAQGDLDGRPFFEPDGAYHFHDLARPSLHGSTGSLTYALVVPRDLAKTWFSPVEDLHGLVVAGEMAKAVIDLSDRLWALLPELSPTGAARFERAYLELLAAGADAARPSAPVRASAEDALRTAAIEAVDLRLGLERASVAELSRVLDASPEHLAAAFRPDGGVAAYLLSRRLIEARAALTGLAREEPIGNIAHRLGFSDAAHLSRAFKQKFGLSPRDYRRMDGAEHADD